jgi:hypothetical protein
MREDSRQPEAPLAGVPRPKSRARLAVGLVLCSALAVQCHQVSSRPVLQASTVNVEIVPTAAVITATMNEAERLARRDPLAFFKYCLDSYQRNIRDYRVTFIKQEIVGEKLAPEQVTEVRFKDTPLSVDMVWTQNPGRADRVLYVRGAKVDKAGNEMALVRPAGILGGIGIKVWREIHGPDAQREARRTIDQFGFKHTLELIIKFSEMAAAEGKLELTFIGDGTIDGRPTYVFERRLPYTGQEQPYPDRLLVVHIDKEWLLPTGCFSYADDGAENLLGRYVLTQAQFNVGYSDADFDASTIKF